MEKQRIVLGVLFALFFLASVATLVGVLIAHDGFEPKDTTLPWWKEGIIYQVYPRSFKDTDGDGVGDLNGITEKLDYLDSIGVTCLWLSPIFRSPMKDFGYDISDYTDIDPLFGSMSDFRNLVNEVHDRGMKIVLDFVPNHSSDQHQWFQKALQGDDQYHDYYVWTEPNVTEAGDPIPPNNWESVFTGSAWNCSVVEHNCFYHAFLSEQPDLNYKNPQVVNSMQNVLTYWLKEEVDGFRVDAVMYLDEDEQLTDNPEWIDSKGTIHLNDTYTTNQPNTFNILHGFYDVINNYPDKLMMVEVYHDDPAIVMDYFGTPSKPSSDFPFNFFLISRLESREALSAHLMFESITDWLDNVPEEGWSNWVIGNHDNKRIASRLGADLVDAFNMINLLLPGTAITYYGEEIGMQDTFISFEDTQDPQGLAHPDDYLKWSRDPERTPMQWDNSSLAGFSDAPKSWLPVNENYKDLNVEQQISAEESHLKIYKELAHLRAEEPFRKGEILFPHTYDHIFSFMRYYDDTTYMITINLSENDIVADLHLHANFVLPENAEFIIGSIHGNYSKGEELELNNVMMKSGYAMVLKINRGNPEE